MTTTQTDLLFALLAALLWLRAPSRLSSRLGAVLTFYCLLEAFWWPWMEATVARWM